MTEGSSAAQGAALARLGAYAAGLVPEGGRVGLGSGRAATAFLEALAARVREGLTVTGVSTSVATAAAARRLGIPLAELTAMPLDLTVDGADEVDPALNLIKGFGGALVRERIVAAASPRQVILVTPDKLVPRLGTRGRLPVEIVPFARPLCEQRLAALGCTPRLRTSNGAPFLTDNANVILDCAIGPLDDPARLEADITAIPGVIDTGLFLGTATMVVVAEADGVRTLQRS